MTSTQPKAQEAMTNTQSKASFAEITMNSAEEALVLYFEPIRRILANLPLIVKRTFDIVISAIFLILLAPAMLVIAASVKFTSKGPILFKGARVGRRGHVFTLLKFRTMYTNMDPNLAHANKKLGHIFQIENDPRVTPVGHFIRRYSLDELPQLINVLRGEMSIVGPRPLPAADFGPDGISPEFADWFEERHSVYPGITGLWQVNDRSELPFEEMVRLDRQYMDKMSLWLDLEILALTPLAVLRQAVSHPSHLGG
jgi:lipopolysaccharide/colanic/teichoic acid biosynthesis glycosyltransferase